MHLKVGEETIAKTTKCHDNFRCLGGEPTYLCPVSNRVSNGVLFVECKEGTLCNYQVPFGYTNVCSCPVRIELYDRYRI